MDLKLIAPNSQTRVHIGASYNTQTQFVLLSHFYVERG